MRDFLYLFNCFRPADRTDRLLNGTLIDMTALRAMLVVPDKFINCEILTTAC